MLNATEYQMSPYAWTDRNGIIVADVIGRTNLTTLAIPPTSTGNYANLAITATSPTPQTIGIALVLWDDDGNPISVASGMITLSGWAQNTLGNFIAANGFGVEPPGLITADVSMASAYTVLVQSFSVQPFKMGGTVATTSGSAAVAGTSSSFLTSGMLNRWVNFSADPTNTIYQVAAVANDTQLTLSKPATFTSSGGTMSLQNPVNLHWRLF